MFNLGKKYKLGKKESVSQHDGSVLSVHRVIALRDIPRYGVKAGDIGGWIESKDNLEQEGDCWVGGNAFVSGRSRVRHNALVTDDANVSSTSNNLYQWVGGNAVVKNFAVVTGTSFIIDDNAVIQDNAFLRDTNVSHTAIVRDRSQVFSSKVQDEAVVRDQATVQDSRITHKAVVSENSRIVETTVMDNAVVSGQARSTKSIISGTSLLSGNARIEDSKVRDNAQISGRVRLNEGTICEGDTKLSGDLIIPPRHYIFNKVLEGKDTSFFGNLPSADDAIKGILPSVESTYPQTVEKMPTSFDLPSIVAGIEKEYKTYSNDIVKLIKYPVMVDPSVPQTQEFLFTLRQAKRFSGDEDAQRELAEKLERTFMVAEAHALKVASSVYSDEERKKTEDAKSFINKACDDNSTIAEKKIGFRATMKALEGIVALPEDAIDAYREKIGLLEIEA